jgi:hypothetical protein
MGTIFAHDATQHARWRSDVDRHSRQPQLGKNLAQLARDFGGQPGGLEVVRGQFELRN